MNENSSKKSEYNSRESEMVPLPTTYSILTLRQVSCW